MPRPGHKAVGEERAWGRRLAKRFGVEGTYDEQTFRVKGDGGLAPHFDHESLKPEAVDPDVVAMFTGVRPERGRLPHRLRLGHGRGPRSSSAPTDPNPAWSSPTSSSSRRMVRAFDTRPVEPEVARPVLDAARRAPSAGNSQGWVFVVLEGDDTRKFWDVTLPEERRETFRWQQLLDAPVVILPLASREAYLARYSEPDKISTGLADPTRWPVPYWQIDTAFATMLLLLAVEDEGLGALFFGVFRNGEKLLAQPRRARRLRADRGRGPRLPARRRARPQRRAAAPQPRRDRPPRRLAGRPVPAVAAPVLARDGPHVDAVCTGSVS